MAVNGLVEKWSWVRVGVVSGLVKNKGGEGGGFGLVCVVMFFFWFPSMVPGALAERRSGLCFFAPGSTRWFVLAFASRRFCSWSPVGPPPRLVLHK